ncbi:MAG: heme-binding domain-containing protein [Daejeonella sp.]
MNRTQKILLAIVAVIVIIQFIRPEKNISAEPGPNDIFAHHNAPDSLKQLIQTACYDCHSNNTKYPWYANIQPVAWWLSDHVKDGKKHLNFSEFATYTAKKAEKKLEEVGDEVKEGEMPLESYTFIHKDADLNDAQRKAIVQWSQGVREEILAKGK